MNQKAQLAITVVLLGLLLSLTGCGFCPGRRATEPAPTVWRQTPDTPLAPPRLQTPVSPVREVAQTPFWPVTHIVRGDRDDSAFDEHSHVPGISLETVRAITRGMTYEEVEARIGHPGITVAGTDTDNRVYRWSRPGLSFMGRFEDGILMRKHIVDMNDGYQTDIDQEVLQFDRVLYEMISPGMTYHEVMAILGMEAQTLSSTDDVVLYYWTDNYGSSITTRFEDGVLARKTGMIVESDIPLPEEKDDVVEADEDNEIAEREEAFVPPVYEEHWDYEEPDIEVPAAPYPEPSHVAPAPRGPRVRVAGASRREREIASDPSPHAGRSYRPRARFPEFARTLRRGVYEIRIHNTTNTGVRIAVISEEGGLEQVAAAGGTISVHVNQGTYRLYFIYNDDPYTLHRGQAIPISEMLSDFSVYIVGDSYELHILDRTYEPTRRSRSR